jgi:RNA polymerase sigma factor (sigma-70 family)
MADRQFSSALRRALHAPESGAAGGLPDAELLERFVAARDAAAFEVLVWRHGPRVVGVCRRVLRHAQDAEDAFQATFLVLARRAASIRKRDAVASWLYGVAYRVALRARGVAARRRAREAGAIDLDRVPGPEPADSAAGGVIDDAVAGLPAHYRAPFLLHYLDGLSTDEVATALACPRGTVLSRLARARDRVRRRLARAGVTVPAALLAATVSEAAGRAAVPPALAGLTLTAVVRAAADPSAIPPTMAALMRGAAPTVSFARVALAGVVVLALALGAGYVARAAVADSPPPAGSRASGAGEGRKGEKESKPAKRTFTRANVRVLSDDDGKAFRTPQVLTVSAADEVDKLCKFFPGAGQGKKGDDPAGWKARVEIELTRSKGKPVKLRVSRDWKTWSEGNGDWAVNDRLDWHVSGLFAAPARKQMQGTWEVVSVEEDGKKWAADRIKGLRWTVKDRRIVYTIKDHKEERDFVPAPLTAENALWLAWPLDPPPQVDAVYAPALYSLKGDELRVCEPLGPTGRPVALKAGPKSGCRLWVLRRVKDGKKETMGK